MWFQTLVLEKTINDAVCILPASQGDCPALENEPWRHFNHWNWPTSQQNNTVSGQNTANAPLDPVLPSFNAVLDILQLGNGVKSIHGWTESAFERWLAWKPLLHFRSFNENCCSSSRKSPQTPKKTAEIGLIGEFQSMWRAIWRWNALLVTPGVGFGGSCRPERSSRVDGPLCANGFPKHSAKTCARFCKNAPVSAPKTDARNMNYIADWSRGWVVKILTCLNWRNDVDILTSLPSWPPSCPCCHRDIRADPDAWDPAPARKGRS